MIGIYNDSSSTTFSVYNYGEIVWPGGSSSSGTGFYISGFVPDNPSSFRYSTFTIDGSTYLYVDYCSSWYGHNYSKFYFSDFDGVITEGAFSGFSYFTDSLETNATRVENNAFAETIAIHSVYLTSASYVGQSAFSGCTNLITASLPQCVTIEPYAFYSGNLAGTNYSFPACKNIGAYAFYGCTNLGTAGGNSTVNFQVCETIGDYAFAVCYGLRHISLPVCRTVGKYAFANTNLSSIRLSLCEYVGDNAFRGITQLRDVELGSCYVGDYAFYGCSNLDFTNMKKVTYIGSSAFMGCPSLSVNNYGSAWYYFSNCEYFGSSAFYGCGITIKGLDRCSYIGSYAFVSALASGDMSDYQVVPWSVPCEYIGSYAFASCSFRNLEIHLPVCSYIGDYVFASGSFTTVRIYLDGSSICELGGNHILSSIHTYMEGIYFYVPSSLYDQYISARYWSGISNKIRSITS